ncbi:3' terminal RNA ribose 2'-O-methyltransferase Hen1 [Geodermatophilus bullaregiensis]|uniref:3' terminal RNA ribose 2'-O-methyltransferase Hen1 n=1 Tax=Geodermatophilus bullaregiensis TaxID=1564160 RepID=UPI0019577B71|nr:3' terminal RNA ribose 2'-O-methyltransferase Hen1 [Geodermatophilus bullaregiensis]MBM7804951.1 3' terminal RNA ribose 2'-O-methyltransferase Hen1 [Geodermatophilus bullaregiensis]
MLVTLSTTHVPATDLGFLLHKNPARAQQVEVSTGTAHVFYPEATDRRCTVALLLEVDPVGLVRTARAGGTEGAALAQYVNDRPYAASSLLAVALGRAFASARRGVSRERPGLVDVALPLEVHVPALSCRGGAEMAQRFFVPLGWAVEATPVPLDDRFPEWGDSRYVDLRLTGDLRLADALNHLYVALPVLDDAKHHWIGTDEVDKLLRAGGGWLAGHPDRDLITSRYLKHRAALTRRAIERLAEVDDAEPDTLDDATAPPLAAAGGPAPGDEATDRPVPLALQRHGAVLAALRSAGAQRVIDLGCGAGALLPALLAEPAFTEVLGVDVSARALEVAARRLRLDRMPERQRARVRLLQSGLTYTDARLRGYDAAVLVEVVEHLDPDRLPALEHAVFGAAAPATVVVTTPNVEYNVRFEGLAAGVFRHRDHRFEWTRAEFAAWASAVGERYGYTVRLLGVGDDDPEVGRPSQMAVFTRGAAEVAA